MKKILIVDDEPDILEFLSYNLGREGYVVSTAPNGSLGLRMADSLIPDLIILDVMMPGIDGLEVCKMIRENPKLKQTYVIFLSARGEDFTQVSGLDAGADDYIVKPIKPKLLVSKIRAFLRRCETENERALHFPNLIINREKYLVIFNDAEMDFPKKEFELLFLLASKPSKLFTREEIYQKVWGDEIIVGDRTIDVHIKKIRDKLGDDIIKTIKGVGYKFNSHE